MDNKKNHQDNTIVWLIVAFCLATTIALLIMNQNAASALSAVGTISLGCITLYQNRVFKKENDKAQERLENISNRSNELNSINLIITYEVDQLNKFRSIINTLIEECSPVTIISIFTKGQDKLNGLPTKECLVELNDLQNRAKKLFWEATEYSSLYDDSDKDFVQKLFTYSSLLSSTVNNICETLTLNKDNLNILMKHINEMNSACRDYRERQSSRINKALYGNLSLAEVKELFKEKETVNSEPGNNE